MKHTNKFAPKSIFDENLTITEELYAVTYGKRSYSSLTPKDPLLAAEHAFIIIQGPNMFYRAEISSRDLPLIETIIDGEKVLIPPTPAFDFVIRDDQNSFCNERTFNQILPRVLHNKKVVDIVNHTWLVPIDKVEELMADIEADMGSITEEEKNSIPYFGKGNESLAYPGKTEDFFNECVRMVALIGSVSAGVIQLKTFFQDCKAHHELKSSATHLCETSGCALDGITKTVGLMTAALSPLWTRAIADSTLEPKKEFPKVHSCATWAAEKLHNLGIEEIDNDLRPSILLNLLDKMIYMTTLHVGDAREIREAAVQNCPHKQPKIHRTMDYVEHVQERKNTVLTADEHKLTRCTIATSGVVIGAIAADIARETVVQSCFDR